jgi:intraflagellar transport protein 52
VAKAPLSLIPPAWEAPLPPLQPAVFPPVAREPPPPPLELFDLDDSLAPVQVSVGGEDGTVVVTLI